MARLRVLVLFCTALLSVSASARAQGPTPARSPVLERQATVVLSVTDRTDALDRIKNAANDLGGHLVQGSGASVTVDVPGASYRKLFDRLAALGDETDVRVTTTDLTDRIAAAQARLRAAREREKRIAGLQGVAHGVPDHLELERAMEDVESDQADARSDIEDLEERARRTRVRIQLAAPPIAPVPPPRLPFPWLAKLGLPRLLDTSARKKPSLRLDEIDDGAVYLQGGYTPEGARPGGARALGALGVTVRVVGNPDPVALFGGFDLSLGASKGFLYGLQSLLGLAVPFGRRVALGVGTGPGIDGITSTIPFAVSIPIDAYLSLDPFKVLGANIEVRDGWVFAARARRNGAPAAPFGDEASAAITFELGTRHGGQYSQNRAGPIVGFAVRQTMGATLYLVNLGFSAHHADYTDRP